MSFGGRCRQSTQNSSRWEENRGCHDAPSVLVGTAKSPACSAATVATEWTSLRASRRHMSCAVRRRWGVCMWCCRMHSRGALASRSIVAKPRSGTEQASRRPRACGQITPRREYGADRCCRSSIKGRRFWGLHWGIRNSWRHLRSVTRKQQVLLDRIPLVEDVRSAWLLLLHCASARAICFMWAVSPNCTEEFAQIHDRGLWQCWCQILQIDPSQPLGELKDTAALPLSLGGLELPRALQMRVPVWPTQFSPSPILIVGRRC